MTILERPETVRGYTYKLNPATAGCAFYLTINDVQREDGSWQPIEVFINAKKSGAYQWTAALTRMLSALMRTGNFEFILEELEQVADPEGAYFDKQMRFDSIVQQVAYTIRTHCEHLNQLNTQEERA